MDDTGSQYLSFASREEARTWIRRLVEGPTSYLEGGEHAPNLCDYRSGRSFCDVYKRTRGGAMVSVGSIKAGAKLNLKNSDAFHRKIGGSVRAGKAGPISHAG